MTTRLTPEAAEEIRSQLASMPPWLRPLFAAWLNECAALDAFAAKEAAIIQWRRHDPANPPRGSDGRLMPEPAAGEEQRNLDIAMQVFEDAARTAMPCIYELMRERDEARERLTQPIGLAEKKPFTIACAPNPSAKPYEYKP